MHFGLHYENIWKKENIWESENGYTNLIIAHKYHWYTVHNLAVAAIKDFEMNFCK